MFVVHLSLETIISAMLIILALAIAGIWALVVTIKSKSRKK